MFIRPQPYTCLGIEWLDPRIRFRAGVVVMNVVTAPLRRGGPTVSLWEIVVTLFSVIYQFSVVLAGESG